MENGDRVIYTLYRGRMIKITQPRTDPARINFLIICDYGDWSGFRSLRGCEKQLPELEEMAAKNKRDDHFYKVVERF